MHNFKHFLCIILILGSIASNANAARILSIFSLPSKSHWILVQPLFRELALAGHDVTLLSPFDLVDPPPNYRNIKIGGVDVIFDEFLNGSLEETDMNPFLKIRTIVDLPARAANVTMGHPAVQNLLKSGEKFDLFILEVFMNEAYLGFAHHFNCPIVGISTLGDVKWANVLTGSPQPLSYVPSPFLPLTQRMNFLERTMNVLFNIIEDVALNMICFKKQENIYNLHFPDPKPAFGELMTKGISVILINSHFTLNSPVPHLPNLIEVAGMHVNTKVQPLPENIKTFIEESKDGVIFFSLGSNVKPSKMPASKRDDIIRALSKRKERVIWKWDDPNILVDKSKIMVGSWFPQDDILAHPNVKLFISHGGFLSCTESIYHGKPIIGIPIFGDQQINVVKAVAAGWGVQIDYTNLTETSLSWGLNEALSNSKYIDNVREISRRFRDQPRSPLETAKYWIEYVIRHKGAPHLRSQALNLNFIEYHNLDSFALIAFVVALVVYTIVYLFKKLLRLVTRSASAKVKRS